MSTRVLNCGAQLSILWLTGVHVSIDGAPRENTYQLWRTRESQLIRVLTGAPQLWHQNCTHGCATIDTCTRASIDTCTHGCATIDRCSPVSTHVSIVAHPIDTSCTHTIDRCSHGSMMCVLTGAPQLIGENTGINCGAPQLMCTHVSQLNVLTGAPQLMCTHVVHHNCGAPVSTRINCGAPVTRIN